MVEEVSETLDVDMDDIEREQEGTGQKRNRPEFRVVQTITDREGKTVFLNVGGMWKNISKNGNEFYSLRIGNLRLLVFKNER